jgi:hypothetical protein
MRLEFTLDCSDLDKMAEFWQAAAGFVAAGSIEGRYVWLSGHGHSHLAARPRTQDREEPDASRPARGQP